MNIIIVIFILLAVINKGTEVGILKPAAAITFPPYKLGVEITHWGQLHK
jgi:hypothetical protein